MIDQSVFKKLLESSLAIPWQAEASSAGFTYIGPQVEALLGYPCADWYRPGLWRNYLHPADSDPFLNWLAAQSGAAAEADIEYRMLAVDGREVWIHSCCVSVHKQGEVTLLSGLMLDITEHRQQTKALAKLNRALQAVNACNSAMIQAKNEHGLLQDICRITVEVGGYRMAWVGIAEQDETQRIRPVAHHGLEQGYLDDVDIRWSDTPQGQGPTGRAVRTGKVAVMRNIATDPSYAPWRDAALQRGYASSVALPLRSQEHAFGVLNIYAHEPDAFDAEEVELLSRLVDNMAYGLTSLSNRQQREATERYLQALHESSPDMIFLHAEDGRLVDVNDNVLRQYGYSREEILALDFRELMAEEFTPEQAYTLVGRAMAGEDLDFEWLARHRDSTLFPIEVRLRRLPGGEGFDGPKVIAIVRDISERKQAEAAISERTAQFEAMFHSLSDAAIFVDPDRRIRLCNPAAVEMFGYSEADLIGNTTEMLYVNSEDYREQGRQRYRAEAGTPVPPVYEMEYRRRDASTFVGETMGCQVRDGVGKVFGFIGVIRDISERKQAQAQMATLSMAVEQAADAISITDPNGDIEYINPAFEQITGYSREEVVGQPTSLIKSDRHDDEFFKAMWQALNAGEPFQEIFINRRKDGELFYEEKTIAPIRDERGDIRHFVATGRDITERMETQDRLRYLAHHDVLTALPNRALFMDRLEHALAKRPREGNMVALLFLDVDRFKLINDTLGHDAGDRLLQNVARRLQRCVRQGDTIARLGGDEFGIVFEELTDGRRAAEVAQDIIDALAHSFQEQGAELFVTSSIGISLAPLDGSDAHTLLKHADVAMYRAKELGRNAFQFYSADMSTQASERLDFETQLRYALERREFVLHYQPQVRLNDGQIIGVEALLRWRHPQRGLIEPTDFVHILEETGLILPVGEWVLRTACHDLQAYCMAYQPLCLSVNLSSRQFAGTSLTQLLSTVLSETGLPAKQLEVEITESLLLRDDAHTLETLTAISDMGIGIAIDDFGTGYSALSYLKRFPIDTLKIDRSFIRDISSDPDDAAIVQAVIAMAKSLSLTVIAEGVASPEQLAFLEAQCCAMAQGYLFGRPGTLTQLREAMENGRAM